MNKRHCRYQLSNLVTIASIQMFGKVRVKSKITNKLAPYETGGQLLLTANFKVT